MEDLKKQSSFRVLFLLNMLFDKERSKNEIIEEFKKNNIEIKKTTVLNYINKLKENNISIITKKIKNTNYYSVEKNAPVSLKHLELSAASDIKTILASDKRIDFVKNLIKVFYKFSLHVKDNNTKFELVNFDYYSKINWGLVKQLEKHCKNKDIISIEYITPSEELKTLTLHCDMIKIGDMSKRLYLSCILNGDNKLSQLPVDKIFTVKKIIKKYAKINLKTNVLIYKISERMLNETGLNKKEKLLEVKNNIATIKCPTSDTFFTLQRLMHFCPELYYVSDENLRNLVKEKLYTLKEMYNE